MTKVANIFSLINNFNKYYKKYTLKENEFTN